MEGLLLLGAGSAFEFGILVPAADAPELGAAGTALGLAIVAVGFLFHESPRYRRSGGAVVFALALVSSAAGGGFVIGMGLAAAGGLLALLRAPRPLFRPPRSGHG